MEKEYCVKSLNFHKKDFDKNLNGLLLLEDNFNG